MHMHMHNAQCTCTVHVLPVVAHAEITGLTGGLVGDKPAVAAEICVRDQAHREGERHRIPTLAEHALHPSLKRTLL